MLGFFLAYIVPYIIYPRIHIRNIETATLCMENGMDVPHINHQLECRKKDKMAVNALYTARATAGGGRNGNTRSDDGLIDVRLSVPKAMGGPGKEGTTTPEHLLAAGYAACFGSACEFMSRQLKLFPKAIEVKCAVGIGPDDAGGFGLVVDLEAIVEGLPPQEAETVVAAGHQACPYSSAVKGNVDVTIKVTTK